MRAGASVALSGLASGSSAVALDPIFRPFVEALSLWLLGRGVPTNDAFVHALTGALVVGLSAFGMWLRLRVLNAERVAAAAGLRPSDVPPSALGLWVVVVCLGLASGCARAGAAAPVVAPEYQALIDADRQSFALAEVARLVDGLSRTHINLEAEGRIAPADDLVVSLSLAYVTRQIRAAVEDLNESGKSAPVRLRELDAALAALWAWLRDRIAPLADTAARAELKAEAGPLVALLEAIRMGATW